jgi:uncharacterized membrane protein YidH (DUF202 family)
MGIVRVIGMVLVAVGIVLLIFGYNASQSVTEKVVEGFTGHFTNQTTWYFIGGVAAVVGGLGLAAWGGGPAKT